MATSPTLNSKASSAMPFAGMGPGQTGEDLLSQVAAELGFATDTEEDALRAVGEAMGMEVVDLSATRSI